MQLDYQFNTVVLFEYVNINVSVNCFAIIFMVLFTL